MKKVLAILCSGAIIVLCAAMLAGCGSSKEIPADSIYIGTWEAGRAELLGEATEMSEVLEGGSWIFTLNADGTAVETSGDDSATGVWSITSKGVKVKLDGSKKSTKFTLEGDELVIKLVAKIYFEKKN